MRTLVIFGLGIVAAVLVTKTKEWLGKGLQQLGELVYRRLAGSALLRATALRRYTRELIRRHEKFSVSFRVDDLLQMDMASVYVPLRSAPSGQLQGQQELAASVRAQRHSVVLGVPGAGKTMLLRHEALTWARQRFPAPAGPERAGRPESTTRALVRLRGDLRSRSRRPAGRKNPTGIPVLLELHRINGSALTLTQHLVDHFDRHGFPNAERWVTRALEAGDLALYFDGLDEVATDQRPEAVRQIKEFAERYHTCRIVVTCRVAVYEGQFAGQFHQTLRVDDFDEHLIRRFLHGWPWPEGPDGRPTKDTVDQLLGALRDTPQLMPLARNPLLLTMIAYLYSYVYAGTDQVLPHTRAEFYRQVTDHLLGDQRRRLRFPHPVKKAVLQHLALAAHDIPPGAHDRLALPEKKVLAHVRDALTDQGRSAELAEDVLDEIVKRSGLLLAVDHGERYQFAHLTLQEYLSARQLAADPSGLLRRYRADPQTWRETVRLWCGVEAHDCTDVVRAVFGVDPVLAFQCLADAYHVADDLADEIVDHFRRRLVEGRDVDGDVIAAFGVVAGDPRPRGAALFEFLRVQAQAGYGRGASTRCAIRALAATNTAKAAEVLILLPPSHTEASTALVNMGDLAIPTLSRAASSGHPRAATDLWRIGTPRAALVLAQLIWTDTDEATHCATLLANLLKVPEVEEELRSARVPADGTYLEWVWKPFARDEDDALIRIAGRMALLLRAAPPPRRRHMTPDQRLLVALCVVRDGTEGFDEHLDDTAEDEDLTALVGLLPWHVLGRSSPMHTGYFIHVDAFGGMLERDFTEVRAGERDRLRHSSEVNLADVGTRVLRAAGMSEQRGKLLNILLPEELRLRVIACLALGKQVTTGDWVLIRDHPRYPQYAFERSWHYRALLVIGAVLSATAAGRALFGLLGHHPWGPGWLNAVVLAQVIVGWTILGKQGALTDTDDMLMLGLAPALVVLIMIYEMDFIEDFWYALCMVGLLPAVSLFCFVTLMNPYGVLVAVTAGALLLTLMIALVLRGLVHGYRARRASHPVRRLLIPEITV